jgi:serine/threonine-protein kinase
MSTERLAAAVSDRYRLEGQLGAGGMATVYLAQDLRHDRKVALKLLRPELAAVLGAERFLSEIKVTASLQHPNIVPLFDSGTADGLVYYVMPFVEGESLQRRLSRTRRLGLDESVALVRQVASALDFAHRRGIVHRDIKPANILISDGHALVADFGIAQIVAGNEESRQRLTSTGVSIGTPGYMSPEQAVGGAGVEARADVYALAAVTHEMLAGEPPFTGKTGAAVVARSLTEPAPSLDTIRRDLPPGVAAAIQRGLAVDAADRFASAPNLVEAIEASMLRMGSTSSAARRRTGVAVTLAVAVVAAAAMWAALRPPASPAASPSVRIAVLPFRESGVSTIAGFSTGLAEALGRDLATLPGVDVVAAASVSALRDSAQSPAYVAAELEATHVLGGTVQWSRDAQGVPTVLVLPELVDVSHGSRTTRGAGIEDRVDEGFLTQQRVSTQIAQALGVPLSAEAVTRLKRPPTRNRAAYEAWLKAQAPGEQQILYLEQAVALDSTFAQAWARLGSVAAQTYRITLRPALAEVARRASSRALALDSLSAFAHVAAMQTQRNVERNWTAAVTHAAAATRLAPGNAGVMALAAVAWFHAGRLDEALVLARKAADLDPRNASAFARVANLLHWRGDLAGAEEYAGRAIRLSDRQVGFINLDSVWLALKRGNIDAARQFSASLPDPAARASLAVIADRDWLQGWALDTASVRYGVAELRREGDRVYYYVVRAREAWRRRDAAVTRRMADSALVEGLLRLRNPPTEERLRIAVGYAQALAGRCDIGIAHADTAAATRSAWKDGFFGAGISLVQAEMYALCGRTNDAVALLDSLAKAPGFVTPAWLRVDPHFGALSKDARFRALAGLP